MVFLLKSNTMRSKDRPLKAKKKDLNTIVQGKTKTQTNHNIHIGCFKCLGNGYTASQCPNKRVTVMEEHEETKYESNKSKEDDMRPLEDYRDVKYPVDGDALMIKRSLIIQLKYKI
jgi:hypothetical protein